MNAYPNTGLMTQKDLDQIRRDKLALLMKGQLTEQDMYDLNQLRKAESAARGNLTRESALRGAGLDAEVGQALSYTEPQAKKNALESILDVLDAPGELLRRGGMETLEAFGRAPQGTSQALHDKDRVEGSDLIMALRGKFQGMTPGERPESDWWDTGGGLMAAMGIDPLMYTGIGIPAKAGATLYKAGTTGGKLVKAGVLNPAGQKARNELVEKVIGKVGGYLERDKGQSTEEFLRSQRQRAGRLVDTLYAQKAEAGQIPQLLEQPALRFAGQKVPGTEGALTFVQQQMAKSQLLQELKQAAAPITHRLDRAFKPVWAANDYLKSAFHIFRGTENRYRQIGYEDTAELFAKHGFVTDTDRGIATIAMERLKYRTVPEQPEIAAKAAVALGGEERALLEGQQVLGPRQTKLVKKGRGVGFAMPEIGAGDPLKGQRRMTAWWDDPGNIKTGKAELRKYLKEIHREDVDTEQLWGLLKTINIRMTDAWVDAWKHGVRIEGFLPFYLPHVYDFAGAGKERHIPSTLERMFGMGGHDKHRIIPTIERAAMALQDEGIPFVARAGKTDVSHILPGIRPAALDKAEGLAGWVRYAGIRNRVEVDAARLMTGYYDALGRAVAREELFKNMRLAGLRELKTARDFSQAMGRESTRDIVRDQMEEIARNMGMGEETIQYLKKRMATSKSFDAETELAKAMNKNGALIKEDLDFSKFYDPDKQRFKMPGMFSRVGMEQDGYAIAHWKGRIFAGPIDTIDALESLSKVHVHEAELAWLHRSWKKINGYFKKMVTLPWPAFHIRNLYGDVQRTMYDNVVDSIDIRKHIEAAKIFNKTTGEIAVGGGRTMTYEQVMEEYMRSGLMAFDVSRYDLDDALAKHFDRLIKHKGNPVATYMDWMRRGGARIENHTKMLMFVRGLKRGLDPSDAANLATKFLFDYDLLTNLDRHMVDYVPFWRWMKKNTAFQAEMFLKNPGKQAATIRFLEAAPTLGPQTMNALGAVTGVEEWQNARPFTEEEQEALPDYIKENVAIPLYLTSEGLVGYGTNVDLPIQEINEIFSNEGIRRSGQKLFARLTPYLRNVMEYFTDQDFFFGTPLMGEGIDERTGRHLVPIKNVPRDMPEAMQGILGAIPGSGYSWEPREGGVGRQLTLSPLYRKMIQEPLGISRAIGEGQKLFRAGEGFAQGDPGKGITALIDMLSALKLREEDPAATMRRAHQGRIYGRGNVLSRMQREYF